MSQDSLKIAFAGSADFSLHILDRLHQAGFNVICTFTQSDKPTGRGQIRKPTPVKAFSQEKKLDCYDFEKLCSKTEVVISELVRPDIFIVVAYGLMIPGWMIKWPKIVCVNIHASLLPCWRGASPIQSALLNNDRESGITLMRLNERLDAGNIIKQESTPIDKFSSAKELSEGLSEMGAIMICDMLGNYQNEDWIGQPQLENNATYCEKINKQDGKIHWKQLSRDVHNMIRAYNPWPVAYSKLSDGRTMRIWESELVDEAMLEESGKIVELSKNNFLVACGEGVISIKNLQIDGGKVITSRDFYNSLRGDIEFDAT